MSEYILSTPFLLGYAIGNIFALAILLVYLMKTLTKENKE